MSWIETKALLLALEDAEVDSGNTETTEAYLIEHFLPRELATLRRAALLLAGACQDVEREVARRHAR